MVVCAFCSVFLNACLCVYVGENVSVHGVEKVKERQRQRPDVCACFSGLLEAELNRVSCCWWWCQPLFKSICFPLSLVPHLLLPHCLYSLHLCSRVGQQGSANFSGPQQVQYNIGSTRSQLVKKLRLVRCL